MHYSHLVKALAASSAWAAILICSALPAAARGNDAKPARAATAAPRAVAAPRPVVVARPVVAPRPVERTYVAPRPVVRTYVAPRPVERTYVAPRPVVRTYAAPRPVVRTYAAPRPVIRTYVAPRPVVRTYAPPRPVVRTYAAPIVHTYAAPRPVVRGFSVPGHEQAAPAPYARNIAPVRYQRIEQNAPRVRFVQTQPRAHFIQTAPRARFVQTVPRQRFEQTAPFVERVRVSPHGEGAHRQIAPFVQYVHVAPHPVSRFVADRDVAESPLMRAVYVPRRPRAALVYHPAYLTGRVVTVGRNVVVLQPPTGREVIVNCACRPSYGYARRYRVNEYVTVPAVYDNGGYYAYNASPAWYAPYYGNASYGDPYAQYNDYYGNYSSSYPQTQPYYYNAYPYTNSYSTPYDNCAWSSDNDNDGDGYCAAQDNGYYNNNSYNGYGGYPYGGYNGYSGYNGYNGYGAYPLQQVQGLVVAKTGSMLMVLGDNGFKPIFVNATPALQNGYAVNGPVAVGQVIDAYGYYNGDMFVATAMM